MKLLKIEKGIAVFTDGSCYWKDRSGGWGWVAIDIAGNTVSDSGYVPDTTISRMELHAPRQALSYLYTEYGPCEVLVYSDSEYVVKGCNDRSRSRRKNPKWWERLDEAINLHTYVEWNHVRGHSDSQYNELADKLAGLARRTKQKSTFGNDEYYE